MPAKNRIIDNKKFSYSGPIDFQKFYKSLKEYWDSKGFDFLETKHDEKVKEDGSRSISLEWHIEKKVTDYVTYSYDISISLDNLKVLEGGRQYAENLSITINGDLITDYAKYFGDKPFNIFLRGLFESYIFGSEIGEHKKNLSKIGDGFLDLAKDLTASFRL
ncbi:MAG: hypothetical protein ACP5G1_01060 [Nanopusillaceae archaeon]